MKKQKTSKRVQRLAFLCSMFIMAFLFTMIFAKEAEAKTLDHQCSLQSVTIEVDGKKYVCDGSLESITVDSNVDWKDFLKKIKITDYKVLVNDCCSHVKGHDSITAKLIYKKPIAEFCIYEEDGTGGKSTYPDIEADLTSPIYHAAFCLDGDINSCVRIAFIKGCQISYELAGGSFLEGMDVPNICSAGQRVNLISPVKSKSQFLGWTLKGKENEGYQDGFCWNGVDSPPTFVANWSNEAPISIEDAKTDLAAEYPVKEGGVTPDPHTYVGENKLYCGRDYYLSYKNNNKPATADSSNPPTVIIEGIGKYTGKVEKKFSISQFDDLYLPFYGDEDVEGNFLYLDVVKGKPLSSIDLSEARVYKHKYNSTLEVKGTFSWENGAYVPDAQVGKVLKNDSKKGETNYNLVFTPDNQNIYSRKIFSEGVYITVKQGSIEDCQITFASGKQSYLYTGESIKPAVIVKDGENVLTEGTDYELSYAGYIKVAGSTDTYAPTVTIKGINSYIGTKKITYTISMSPEAPVLTPVNETIKGKRDGSINGLTTDMEYRMAVPSVGENTAAFTPVTDATMAFPAGAYEVRYAAKGNYDSSPVTTVVIQQGEALTITLPAEQTGYTLTATANNLSWQGTTTLTLTLAPGYTKTKDFALEANMELVDNQDGTYTISGVTKNVTVTVKGIADVTLPMTKPTAVPTATPTATPIATPTATPTAEPTAKPTAVPTAKPTAVPTAKPTAVPTAKPTAVPTAKPTAVPTAKPTAEPTAKPTAVPTAKPTAVPTAKPTAVPTTKPTAVPTAKPTAVPTSTPTGASKPPKKGDMVADDKGTAKVEVENVTKKEVTYEKTANKKAKTVSIPATVKINGVTYKVTKIVDNAFKGNKNITKVTIGSNIKNIGKNVFSGCKKLKTIKIISTKLTSKTVAKNAFKGISKDTIIKVPKKKQKAYKKLFKTKGLLSKVKVIAY